MGGIIDRLTGDRVRPETLRKGDERETPLESFLRRTGQSEENISKFRQLSGDLDDDGGFAFEERRRRTLDTDAGPDAIRGPGGVAGLISKAGTSLLGGPSLLGVPINPLRLITNGFHMSQKYAGDPIAGLVVGGFLGNTMGRLPGLRNTGLGDAGRKFVDDVMHGDGRFWTDAGNLHRDRDSIFWGEKFISSVITDPLNLVGFGILGKIPVVGRTGLHMLAGSKRLEFSLGGIENGYIAAVNMPFKAAGRVAMRFPSLSGRLINTLPGVKIGTISNRARNQLVADAGARAADDIRAAYSRAAGGKAHTAVSEEDLMKFAGEAMNMDIPYGQLPTREHRKFRDLILEADPLSRRAVQRLARAAGSKERVFRNQRFSVGMMVELAVRGRASVPEVAERIIRTVGGDTSLTRTLNEVEGLINETIQHRFSLIERTLAEASPDRLERQLVRKAMRVQRNRIDQRFEEWALDNGRLGGLVKGFDTVQTRVWQNGINRFLARPMATAILKTPEFLISNVGEDAVRVLTGRASLIYRGVDDMSIDFAGYSVYSRGLFQVQNPNANRIAGLSQFDEFKEVRDLGITDLLPGFKGKDTMVNAGRQLGDRWFETANAIASNARRGFFTERTYKRLSEVYQDEHFTRGLADALGSLPAALANSDYGSIVRTATIRAGRGNGDPVRLLKEELTKEKVDLKNAIRIIDTMATDGGLDVEVRTLWHDWALKGGDLNLADDLMRQSENVQFRRFMESPQRAAIQITGLLKAIKNVDITDDAARLSALRQLDDVMTDLLKIPHKMERGVTRRIRRGDFGRSAKFDLDTRRALHEQVEAGQTELFDVLEKQIDEITQAALDLSKGDDTWANLHRKQFNVARDTREIRNERLQDLFSGTNDRSSYFWEVEVDEVLDDAWSAMEREVDALDDLRRKGYALLGDQVGNDVADQVSRKVPKNIFSADKPFGEHELAQIMKGDAQQIQQAIIGDAALSKTRFIERVIKQASEVGADIPKTARDRIGRVYDDVLSNLGIEDSIHSAFSAREETLASLRQQLIQNKTASKFTPGLKRELDDYLERVAAQLDNLSPTARARLRKSADGAVGEATQDLKAAFVNYDDQTFMDSFMTSIFPFWTYESRRIPYLARVGVQNPMMWKTFGPEGLYDESTENGYIRADIAGLGTEFNILGGTAFNAPRRMFRAEFPAQHDGGFLGQWSSAEEAIARFGFYPGPHVKMLTEGILPALSSGAESERGEFLPTSYANVLNLAGSSGQLPGLGVALKPIADPLNRIKDLLFNDRFRERQILKELWDMNLPADQIDITTMRPRAGSIVTQEDMRDAMRRSSTKEAITGLIGKIRFRSDSEVELRDAIAEIYEIAGLPRDMQEKALKAGIPRSSLVALAPSQQEILNNLPGADEYRAINSVLRSPKAKEISEKTSRMWEAYRARVEAIDEQQHDLDLRWIKGEVAPSDYRDLTSGWSQQRSQTLPTLRGRLRQRNSDGQLVDTPLSTIEMVNPETGQVTRTRGAESAPFFEVPMTADEHLALAQRLGRDDFQPLLHEIDSLVEEYRSYVPTDMDGDGRPEWNVFFRQRERFIDTLPEEVKKEFLAVINRSEELAPGIPSPQGILRSLSTTKLGEYWAIDERIQEQLGVEKLVASRIRARRIGDEEDLRFYRINPLLRIYDRRVREERERARKLDPMLDYALNVFGFTGTTISFKNRVAQQWWRSDGSSPNMSRFETLAR